MGIAEKEGDLPVFNTDILNTFFFFLLPTAESTAQLPSKIGAHITAVDELTRDFFSIFTVSYL